MLGFHIFRKFSQLQCSERVAASMTFTGANCTFVMKGLSAVEARILPGGVERPRWLLVLILVSLFVGAAGLAVSAFKVHQDFGWRSFSATSNDPQSRLRLRIYSVWRAMCKIDTVLVFMLLLVGNLLCLCKPGSEVFWYCQWNISLVVLGPFWQLPARRVLQSRSNTFISNVMVMALSVWGSLLLFYVAYTWRELVLGSGNGGALKRVWATWVQVFLFLCTIERILVSLFRLSPSFTFVLSASAFSLRWLGLYYRPAGSKRAGSSGHRARSLRADRQIDRLFWRCRG